MSVVQVYYSYTDGTTDLIGVYDTERIKAHSALIRRMLATQEPTIMYGVYLNGPTTTIESLKTVLQSIHEVQQGNIYQMRITTRDLAKAINIHYAIRYLQVEPEQTKVTGHLTGYVCHQLINPDEMVAIYHAYGNPYNPYHKIFRTMIQRIAWSNNRGEVPQKLGDLYKEYALRYPAIDAALTAKVKELREHERRKQEAIERQAARNGGTR